MSFFFKSAPREQQQIKYLQPVAFLDEAQLRMVLERNMIPTTGCRGREELLARVVRHKIHGLDLSGMRAIEAKAREMLEVISRLDRKIRFQPGRKLGLMLKQSHEWALVQATPPKGSTKVRVGDVLAKVNGESVLLSGYEEMFEKIQEARLSGEEYILSFRRAPFHKGWLYKKARGKSDSIFSGATGWKLRYFVLAYGIFAYYDDEPKDGGVHKGFYRLEDANRSQTLVTTAPAEVMGSNVTEAGLMLVKGEDRLVLKSASRKNDIVNWAALLHIAVAHANGGNDLLKQLEKKCQATKKKQKTPASSSRREKPVEDHFDQRPQPPEEDQFEPRGSYDDDDALNLALQELAQRPQSSSDDNGGGAQPFTV